MPKSARTSIGLCAALAILALGLGGCAQPIKRTRALDIRFIHADAVAVSEHCKKGVGLLDSGAPVTPSTVIRCCTHRRFGHWTVFVGYGNEDCIPHELCHVEGRPSKDCAKIHMDDRYNGEPTGLWRKR